MIDYQKAINRLLKKEGGYVNDPDDNGGETYKGITRKNFPKLEIWNIIDNYKVIKTKNKLKSSLTAILSKDLILDKLVKDFYKVTFWDKFDLDNIKSQRLAQQIFEDAVNRGITAATKTLQRIYKLPVTGKINKELINKLTN